VSKIKMTPYGEEGTGMITKFDEVTVIAIIKRNRKLCSKLTTNSIEAQ
jgi:hypothetical protein